MPPKLPRKYFAGYTAKINYRKVDKWAERLKDIHPYFDTWKEAHDHMLSKACLDVKKFEKNLASAKRHLTKVMAMEEPENEKMF